MKINWKAFKGLVYKLRKINDELLSEFGTNSVMVAVAVFGNETPPQSYYFTPHAVNLKTGQVFAVCSGKCKYINIKEILMGKIQLFCEWCGKALEDGECLPEHLAQYGFPICADCRKGDGKNEGSGKGT